MDKKLPKSMEEMIKNVREKLGNEKKEICLRSALQTH